MWRTPRGERVLEGAEAELFQYPVRCYVEELLEAERFEDNVPVGVGLFDALTLAQKLAMLDEVSQALLCASVPRPALTAISEGTVAAVFAYLLQQVEIELDNPDEDACWRPRILNAAEYCGIGVDIKEACDMDEWGFVVQQLRDCVLWDTDWEDADLTDLDPATSSGVRRTAGIDDDYYRAIAPDPRPNEIPKIRARILALCNVPGS